MESFEIRWRNSTRKDLRAIPPADVAKIIDAVTQLATDPLPHGSHKLAGSERTHRIRVGDYRVVYELRRDESCVEIQRVRHRKDVYR